MKMRAVLGGLAIVATVALARRPSGPEEEGKQSFCIAAGAAGFCDAVAGLTAAFRNLLLSLNRAGVLPPPGTTGVIGPVVSQISIDRTICWPGYTRAARPADAVSAPQKRHLMAVQHPGERMADYELDHLVPILIGGAPFDARPLVAAKAAPSECRRQERPSPTSFGVSPASIACRFEPRSTRSARIGGRPTSLTRRSGPSPSTLPA